MILGIDTAGTALGVALCDGDRILGSMTISRPNVHDALLIPVIRDVLAHCGITPQDLTGLAVSAGPGSFTGLRIGMAAAKGMAITRGIPLAAVPTMDAIAFSVGRRSPMGTQAEHDAHATLCVAIDARKDHVYHARYRFESGRWQPANEASYATVDAVARQLPEGTLLAGDASARLFALSGAACVHTAVIAAEAADIALLGRDMISAGDTADPDSCEPLYMQEFIVKQAKSALFPSSD